MWKHRYFRHWGIRYRWWPPFVPLLRPSFIQPYLSYSSRAAVRACRSPAFPTPLNKTRHALRLPSRRFPSPSPSPSTALHHPRPARLCPAPSLSSYSVPLSPSGLSLSPINKIAHLPRKLIARLNFSGGRLFRPRAPIAADHLFTSWARNAHDSTATREPDYHLKYDFVNRWRSLQDAVICKLRNINVPI